ncbi:hypothetical protein TWF225_001511 [Orbilia oligospora]|nr:hypothetical protein TWF706_009480 [Orbilia oligospora]KAF3191375.1 hypothetical protein TWF225_001511 [Orbilia oligospora]KAF3267841.1 hypothetical protein TWF217_011571 [Orbilia oligospora]KAF3269562.1 hypothetical protein TWF128_005768 [Orbilia oligospora]
MFTHPLSTYGNIECNLQGLYKSQERPDDAVKLVSSLVIEPYPGSAKTRTLARYEGVSGYLYMQPAIPVDDLSSSNTPYKVPAFRNIFHVINVVWELAPVES